MLGCCDSSLPFITQARQPAIGLWLYRKLIGREPHGPLWGRVIRGQGWPKVAAAEQVCRQVEQEPSLLWIVSSQDECAARYCRAP